MPNHIDHNRRAWNRRVEDRERFTSPASDKDFADPLAAVDGVGWIDRPLTGLRVLCLAAGGGRQGPLYAAAGAVVTVVDISANMLAIDRQVARQRNLELRTVEANMESMPMFADASFDLVVHPVSTCYVPDVKAVFAEVARITAAEGLYISQHKTPVSLQASQQPAAGAGGSHYQLLEPYYRQGPLPDVSESRLRESGTLEYLHRWEQLLGGICLAGFVIEDVREPFHASDKGKKSKADSVQVEGSFAHRALYVAPYVRIKARRKAGAAVRPALLMK